MNGELSMLVSGPVPGSGHSDAEAATRLLRELRDATGVRVSRADAGGEPRREGTGDGGSGGRGGSKGGGAGNLPELLIAGLFSASTMAALARVAVAFVRRGAARRITLRDGARTFTITDPSPGTERALVAWLDVPAGQRDVDADTG